MTGEVRMGAEQSALGLAQLSRRYNGSIVCERQAASVELNSDQQQSDIKAVRRHRLGC